MRTEESPPPPSAAISTGWIAGALVVVVALQVFQSWQLRDGLAEFDAAAARLEKAAILSEQVALQIEVANDRLERVEEHIQHLSVVADEWEFLSDDVRTVKSRVDDLVVAFEGRDGEGGYGSIPQPPDLDWTEPALFDAAQRAAATVGIELTADEVRVPARIVLREGLLEYFAVLKGGKEHEALLSLVGNLGQQERRPREFGAKLNNAIQALGLPRGSPIRFSPSGTRPARGEPIYLFVEWEAEGETVSVRAEDLVWDRRQNAPMPRDTWVFVGSSWVEGDTEGELLFAADLTAEAVATYSAVNAIIDTTAPGAQDDTVFLVASPRVPDDVVDVTLVIRAKDRAPTLEFPLPEAPGPGMGDGDE